MAKTTWLVGLFALGAVGTLVGAPLLGIHFVRDGQGGRGARRSGSRAQPTPKLPRLHAAAQTEQTPQEFVGVLLPSQVAELSPRSGGKVLTVHAQTGQAVERGDPLLTFDRREKEHELAMAAAQHAAALSEQQATASALAAARRRFGRRQRRIRVDGRWVDLVSGEERAQARADVDQARAQLDAAKSRVVEQANRVEQLRLALAEEQLRAPFTGVVSFIHAEPSARLHPGQVVARLVGGSGLRARIAVPEDSAEALQRSRARLTLENGEQLDARIEHISPEPDPAARAFILEAAVERSQLNADAASALAGRPVHARLLKH